MKKMHYELYGLLIAAWKMNPSSPDYTGSEDSILYALPPVFKNPSEKKSTNSTRQDDIDHIKVWRILSRV